MVKRLLVALNATILLISCLPTGVVAAEEIASLPLLISEVKVRNDSLGFDEYIEIFNTSNLPVNIAEYSIHYFNTTNPTTDQQPVAKPLGIGWIAPESYLVLAKQPPQIMNSFSSPFTSMADAAGRLRLMRGLEVVDEVAWTSTASVDAPEMPIVYTPSSSSTKSITRLADDTGLITVIGLWVVGEPSPVSNELYVPLVEEEPPDEGEDPTPPIDDTPVIVVPPATPLTCEEIRINEILPNPTGVDAGKEYIELHNPTDEVISLAGCRLQTSANSKTYAFGVGTELQPDEYRGYFDTETLLTLPNGAGGTVWLLTNDSEEHTVSYPRGLADNVSWAYIDGAWKETYEPTPGAQNILGYVMSCSANQEFNELTKQCENKVSELVTSLTPCKVGQERNPETNRCRTIAPAVTSLVSCRADQIRNPETNRCRSVASTSTSLTPCKEGQERNPDTNRCKTIGSVSGVSQPCPAGQQRNSDTNRCRKIAAPAAAMADVTDIDSGSMASSPRWWVAGFAILSVAGYGIYEWRHDFLNLWIRLKSRYLPNRSAQ